MYHFESSPDERLGDNTAKWPYLRFGVPGLGRVLSVGAVLLLVGAATARAQGPTGSLALAARVVRGETAAAVERAKAIVVESRGRVGGGGRAAVGLAVVAVVPAAGQTPSFRAAVSIQFLRN